MKTRLTTKLLAAVSALMLLQSCAASAQQQASVVKEQKAEQERAGPTLTAYLTGIRSEATKRDLAISSLEVGVDVRGDIAETTVTVAFENPTNEIL